MFGAALAVLGPLFWLFTALRGLAGLDFIAFYSSSLVFLTQGPAAVFDLGVMARTQASIAAAWGGQPFLPDFYPPFWVAAQAWLALLPLRAAYLAWGALTIGATAAALVLLAGSAAERGRSTRWAMLIGAGFLPVTVNLVQGQADAFVLLAAALALRLWTAGRETLAGAALGFLLIKPQLGILLLALPFLRPSARAVAGMLATSLALGLTSVVVFGLAGVASWAHLLGQEAVASSQGPAFRPWLSLRGPLVAAGLPLSVQYAVLGALAVAVLVLLAARRREIRLDFAIATLGALLLAPHLNIHDLSLLVVPGFALLAGTRARGWLGLAYAGATAAVWIAPAAFAAGLLLLCRALFGSAAPASLKVP